MEESQKAFDNIAHASFLGWAFSFKEIQEAFKKDTGKSIDKLINRSIIEQMIDDATGYEKDVVAEFIVWATENYWASPKECGHIEAYQKAKKDIKSNNKEIHNNA